MKKPMLILTLLATIVVFAQDDVKKDTLKTVNVQADKKKNR